MKANVEYLVGKTRVYRQDRWFCGGRLRVKAGEGRSGVYHVMSRTCGGEVRWDEEEKQGMKELLWRMADFLGLRVLTYCVMGNHFHVLVELPDRKRWLQRFAGEDGEARLMEHLATFYSEQYVALLKAELALLRKMGAGDRAEAILAGIQNRFCDVSIFGKELKERFSRWFNARHERRGTLWMERFKSVLVGDGEALRTMAAYIDMNPVRARLVGEAKGYRWSGFAEAVKGRGRAREGIERLMTGCGEEKGNDASKALAVKGWQDYLELISRCEAMIQHPSEDRSRVSTIQEARGAERLVMGRVRHFSDGLVVGGKAFVEEAFERYRGRFGPRRSKGAKTIRGLKRGTDLVALRDLGRVESGAGPTLG